MEIGLMHLHSFVRWLVVVATLVGLAMMLRGLVTKAVYDKLATRAMSIFSMLIGAQWLVGIILLVVVASARGMVTGIQWSHAGTMTLALVVAHVHYMVKKRDDRTRYIAGLGSIVLTLVLVYVGVALLPGGWTR